MADGRAAGNAWRLVSQYRGAGSVKLIGQRSKTPPVMYFYGASVDIWLPDNLLGPHRTERNPFPYMRDQPLIQASFLTGGITAIAVCRGKWHSRTHQCPGQTQKGTKGSVN